MSGRQYLKSLRKDGALKDELCVLHSTDEPETKPPGFIESLPLVTSENSGSAQSPQKPEEKKGEEPTPPQVTSVPHIQKPEEKKAAESTSEQPKSVPSTQKTEGKKTISDPQPVAGQIHEPESSGPKEPAPHQSVALPQGQKPEEKKEVVQAAQTTKNPHDASIKELQKPSGTAPKESLGEPVPVRQETEVTNPQLQSISTHATTQPLISENPPQSEGCELSWPVGKLDTWEEKAIAESLKHDLPRKEALVSKAPQPQEPPETTGFAVYAAAVGVVFVIGVIWFLKSSRS